MKKLLLSLSFLAIYSLGTKAQTTICSNSHIFTEAYLLDSMTVDPAGNSDIDDWDIYLNGVQIFEGHFDATYSFNVGFFNWQYPPFREFYPSLYIQAGDVLTQTITTSSGSITGCAELYLRSAFNVVFEGGYVACVGGNDGTATVSVTGGTPPYDYVWSTHPAQYDSIAIGLSAGIYTVTITDANNTVVPFVVNVEEPNEPLSLDSIIVSNASCSGCVDGTITPSASGGMWPYTWTCDGTWCTDLSPGTYNVCVVDAGGCMVCSPAQVTFPTAIFEEEATQLSIIPNPATDWVQLTFTQPINGDITLYNQTGQVVLNEAVSNSVKQELNVSHLPAGLYLLNVRGEKQSFFEKLIITK